MARLKYGGVKTEKGDIPEDEPVFILRAQDVFSPTVVRFYATLRASIEDFDGAKECHDFAEVMEAWPKRKIPD